MVVYNGERFLREAVESVLAQTLRDFEFVVVDDGSTDSSLAILRAYSHKDPRVLLIEAPHIGITAARNLAMARASSDLIAVMDADDRMLPQRLERQLWFLTQNPGLTIACSFAYLIDAEGNRIGRSSHEVDVDAGIRSLDPSLFLEIVHPSVLAVKADLLAVGGYQGSGPLRDRDLWGRLVTAGYRIRCQREVLLEYRLHCGAVTAGGVPQAGELIDLNVIRRLRGDPEIPYDCFAEWNKSRSAAHRLSSLTRRFASTHYKRATRYYAERRWWRCASELAGAALARPGWTASRALSALTMLKDRSL